MWEYSDDKKKGVGVSDVWREHCEHFSIWRELTSVANSSFTRDITDPIVTSSVPCAPSFILIWISSPKTPRLINEIVESERDTKVHFISTRSSLDENERAQEKEISRLVAPTHSKFKTSRLQPLPFSDVINQPLFCLLSSSQVKQSFFSNQTSRILCVWLSFAFH